MGVPQINQTQPRYFKRLLDGVLFAPALSDITRIPELWNIFVARQKFKGTAHGDTQTIPLRGPETLDNILDNMDSVNYKIFPSLRNIADLVHDLGDSLGAREFGRVMLVKLKAGGRILEHRDEGRYARYYARFHLPLDTHRDVLFHCENETVNMQAGELWWFNHQKNHSVENLSHKDRIHLIFDASVPGFTGALGG